MGSDRLDVFGLVGNVMAGLHIARPSVIPITWSLFVRADLEDHKSDDNGNESDKIKRNLLGGSF
jgi:hypothetical protein